MSNRAMSTEHKIREYFGGKVLSGRCSDIANPIIEWENEKVVEEFSIELANGNTLYLNGNKRLLDSLILHHRIPQDRDWNYPTASGTDIIPSYITKSAYGNMYMEPLLFVEVNDVGILITGVNKDKKCRVDKVLDFSVMMANRAISMGNRNSEHKEDYVINHEDRLGITLYINKKHCKGTDAIPVTKLVRPIVSALMRHCVDYNWESLSKEWRDYLNYKTDVLVGEHEDETLESFTYNEDSSNQIARSNSELLESVTEFSTGEKNYDEFANRFIK